MDEPTQDRRDDLEEEFRRSDDRGEVIWVSDLSEEEKQEWENRALNDNNVIEMYKGEDVVAYKKIPEGDTEPEDRE